MNSSSL